MGKSKKIKPKKKEEEDSGSDTIPMVPISDVVNANKNKTENHRNFRPPEQTVDCCCYVI